KDEVLTDSFGVLLRQRSKPGTDIPVQVVIIHIGRDIRRPLALILRGPTRPGSRAFTLRPAPPVAISRALVAGAPGSGGGRSCFLTARSVIPILVHCVPFSSVTSHILHKGGESVLVSPPCLCGWCPAVSYSPTHCRVQYHRRSRA